MPGVITFTIKVMTFKGNDFIYKGNDFIYKGNHSFYAGIIFFTNSNLVSLIYIIYHRKYVINIV